MTRWRSMLVGILIVLCGCASSPVKLLVPPEPPIVWPRAPDRPRVRYLGKLKSSRDMESQGGWSRFWHDALHGPTPPRRLVSPYAVAVHAEGRRVAIADPGDACVHLFDLDPPAYDRKDSFGASGERFEAPVGVGWLGNDLWVADAKRQAVVVLESGGGAKIVGGGILDRPAGLACRPEDKRCYVVDAGRHEVLVFDRQGSLVLRFGERGSGPSQFNYPSHIACARDGTIVVSDSLNFRIQRFDSRGTFLGDFGRKGDAAGDLALPKGVAIDPENNIWVVDANYENVQGFTPDGKLLMALGREGHEPGQFWLPAGIRIDSQRRMWVADTHNRRVQVFELLQ